MRGEKSIIITRSWLAGGGGNEPSALPLFALKFPRPSSVRKPFRACVLYVQQMGARDVLFSCASLAQTWQAACAGREGQQAAGCPIHSPWQFCLRTPLIANNRRSDYK